jgi:stearoyl-CoA desaturase (delta-9 desaturase)
MPAQLTALRPAQRGASYDGTAPFPGGGHPPGTAEGRGRVAVTAALVIVPFAGLATAVWLAWGHGLGLADILLAAVCYLVTWLGVTVGFHRLLTHRSFTAARPFAGGAGGRGVDELAG